MYNHPVSHRHLIFETPKNGSVFFGCKISLKISMWLKETRVEARQGTFIYLLFIVHVCRNIAANL